MALNDSLPSNAYGTVAGPALNTAGSAVSWGAIVAGAAAAAALSLILLLLGSGLGLSSVSPWSTSGVAAATFGLGTILWITITQLAASGMGGYLAGRLRTRWPSVHTDEVYFRDTAHGFLAWAVATLVTAAALTSAIGSILGTGAQAGASVLGGVAGAASTAATAATAGGTAAVMSKNGESDSGDGSSGGPMGYFVDSLFRKDARAAPGAPDAAASSGATGSPSAAAPATSSNTATAPAGDSSSTAASTREVARIIANAVTSGNLPAEDSRYVGQVIAQRTGISQADAEKRVADTYARVQTKLRDAQNAAKEAADKARKATAYGSLWLFVSLLVGAFVASLSATYGGRRRDA